MEIEKSKLARLVREFENSNGKRKTDAALEKLSEFRRKYPFVEDPAKIDMLKSKDIYVSKTGESCFLKWIEFELKDIGSVSLYGDEAWRMAARKSGHFKKALKQCLDKSKTVAQRIDTVWGIRKWGGDKQYAKKIIACYFPDEIIPIFKTADMEYFTWIFDIEMKTTKVLELRDRWKNFSVGEKFEKLNEYLLSIKNEIAKGWKPAHFSNFLYTYFTPPEPKQNPSHDSVTLEFLNKIGFGRVPTNEVETMCVFMRLIEHFQFTLFKKYQSRYPDAIMHKNGSEVKVEFEHTLSNFREHLWFLDKCDYIICWENDWPSAPDCVKSKTISIKDKIGEILKTKKTGS